MLGTIPPPALDSLEIGPLSVRLYALFVIGGGFALFFIAVRRATALGVDREVAERVGTVMFITVVLGTRLGYVVPRLSEYVDRPWAVLFLWEGGLAIYGGIVTGIVTALVLSRRMGFDGRSLLDAVAPAAPIGQAIGRVGNYFNQELFGTPTELPWGLEVEPPHRPGAYAEFTYFHPTFLYESIYNVLLAAALFAAERRGWFRRPGSLFLLYVFGYSFGRFWIELLRTETTYRFLGLSRNNWVSAVAFLAALGALVFYERRANPDQASTAVA
ncbi:MAG: prolipoprotein diacylglyceryl transferase [Actinomycetota bacterium]|nr:prolipoprotein diacylglyceryl transferase [Actinomycetota bacterium]